MHRTGIERMSTAWKAAMLPLHQRCWECLRSERSISELSNMNFSLHIFWVAHQKKPKLFFERRSSFFANQTNFFLINRKLSFLVCYFSRFLGIQKEKRIFYFLNFCPSNAHNSNVQSFREMKNVFTAGRMSLPIVRESKPCYHSTSLEGGYATTTE